MYIGEYFVKHIKTSTGNTVLLEILESWQISLNIMHTDLAYVLNEIGSLCSTG